MLRKQSFDFVGHTSDGKKTEKCSLVYCLLDAFVAVQVIRLKQGYHQEPFWGGFNYVTMTQRFLKERTQMTLTLESIPFLYFTYILVGLTDLVESGRNVG